MGGTICVRFLKVLRRRQETDKASDDYFMCNTVYDLLGKKSQSKSYLILCEYR